MTQNTWHSSLWEKHRLICKRLSPAHALVGSHGQRQPVEARRGRFTSGRWRAYCSPDPQGRGRNVPPLRARQPPRQCLPLSCRQPVAAVSVPSRFAGPALLLCPVLPPPEPEKRQICTARKRAAAAIIALIACFFCQAEISGGATTLLRPPKTSEFLFFYFF